MGSLGSGDLRFGEKKTLFEGSSYPVPCCRPLLLLQAEGRRMPASHITSLRSCVDSLMTCRRQSTRMQDNSWNNNADLLCTSMST